MAVNKLVRELPIKSTVFGGDRILVDDGITKTSFLSSLRTYFLSSDSDAQNLAFNKTYLNITGGNTVPLTGFDNINAEQKLLSAGKDLLQIFVTSESDSQSLSYTAPYLSISNSNTIPITSFSTTTTTRILSANTDLLSIFAPTAAVVQTLSASEEYLNISNSNRVALSSLDTTKYFYLNSNLQQIPVSADRNILGNDILNLKNNTTYEIEYTLNLHSSDFNYAVLGQVLYQVKLSGNNVFNFVAGDFTHLFYTPTLGSANVSYAVISGIGPVINIPYELGSSTNYGKHVVKINFLLRTINDTNLFVNLTADSGPGLSGTYTPLIGSYRKVTPIE